ncbi:MAG: flagellar export chaperone FlgN [Pseudomonadales bacterium]|nr:flagellar export chaperone FlgN [Pseudomonadales bacterium]MCP5184719.1 flagellar export chaperone FlgN [Pseudomonadales bacterium]
MNDNSKIDGDVLYACVASLSDLFQELLDQLETERSALRCRDLGALRDAIDGKATTCSRIERFFDDLPAPLPDLVEGVTGDIRGKLDTLHDKLRELAREAKDSNAVNGKIIHRSQQSARDLIGILGDSQHHVLYGEHGVYQNRATHRGFSITQA